MVRLLSAMMTAIIQQIVYAKQTKVYWDVAASFLHNHPKKLYAWSKPLASMQIILDDNPVLVTMAHGATLY